MLVLSRRTDEAILLPDLGITIKVIKVRGKTVSIGIEAPDEIQILRGELVEAATSFNESQPPSANLIPLANCPDTVISTTTV